MARANGKCEHLAVENVWNDRRGESTTVRGE